MEELKIWKRLNPIHTLISVNIRKEKKLTAQMSQPNLRGPLKPRGASSERAQNVITENGKWTLFTRCFCFVLLSFCVTSKIEIIACAMRLWTSRCTRSYWSLGLKIVEWFNRIIIYKYTTTTHFCANIHHSILSWNNWFFFLRLVYPLCEKFDTFF